MPAAPLLGQCWVVGSAATGGWLGHDGALAGWTAGGWRFVAPQDGMQVWSIADGVIVRRAGGVWIIGAQTAKSVAINGLQVLTAQQPAIVPPSGGSVIDTQTRATVITILNVLKTHGLIAI